MPGSTDISNETSSGVTSPMTYFPPYNSFDPTTWIKLMEHAFKTFGVSDCSQKLHYIISALPQNLAARACDFLSPPTEDNYLKLKDLISKSGKVSDTTRIRELLS